ncbi:MAG: hypothetical protein RLZZ618_3384 [Pseudomonadota bacterium]|jgi:predicted dehydrogenase
MHVLMVGTGSIGRRHMASLRRLVPEVHFDVLREDGRSRDVSELGEVTVSSSLSEAVAKRPDLMVIANPSSMHLRFLLAAIEHGIPFYAEKPLLTDAAELQALQAAVATAGAALPVNIVGCNLRFLPSLRELHRTVTSGELGTVVRASFEAGQWLPDWRPTQDYRQSYSARRELGGGVLFDLIHEIDAARWILGDFSSVQAQLARCSSLEIETEDSACLLLRAQRGALATVQLDYVSRRSFRRYRVVGDQASAEWDLPSRTLTITGPEGARLVDLGDAAFDVSATYIEAMRELLNAIAHRVPTAQPVSEGIASLGIVMQAYAQQPLLS